MPDVEDSSRVGDTGELTLDCQHCGQSFTYTKTVGPRRMYCSRRCSGAAGRAGKVDIGETTLDCQQCGESFTYIKTTGARRKFCSGDCQRAAIASRPYGLSGTKRDVGELTLTCGHCGVSFTYVKTNGPRRQFCSQRCKANAGEELRKNRQEHATRRCKCGSAKVARVGTPVCVDCRKDKRDRDPEKVLSRNRARRLSLYSLTQSELDELLTLQRGRCAVCTTDEPGAKGWHIDHDHACCPGIGSCGQCVRGLLCHDCNLLLGHAKDSIEVLDQAKKYLVSNSQFRLKLQVVKPNA